MTESKKSIESEWVDPEDAPDLSTPERQAKFDAAPVVWGRPRSPDPKVSTTLRLDADIVRHFRSGGPGWQSRINEALRDWIERGQR
jgi:uncharacterized protein (DUF4415 family)